MPSEMLCPHCQLPVRLIAASSSGSASDAQKTPREQAPDAADTGLLLEEVAEAGPLTTWEEGFVRDTRARYNRAAREGKEVQMTVRQMASLRKILSK